jgi:Lsr2
MAQRQLVQLGCDLENGKVTSSVQTVTFGYGGGTYELELCARHRKPLAELLTELVESGRKVGSPRSRSRAQQRPVSDREENAEIRAWAAANGIKVSERGRIAANVIELYHHREETGGKKVVTLPAFRDGTTGPAL